MNSWERFRAFARRERIDRPLRYAQFTPDLAERLAQRIGTGDFEAYFEMDLPVYVWPAEPNGFVRPDFTGYFSDVRPGEMDWIDEIGVGRRRGSLYHFTERVSPLRNAERLADLEEFPVVDYEGWDGSRMAAEVDAVHRRGRIAGGNVGHIYEYSWQVRGYEEFLSDMLVRPEWCDVLLDKFMRRAMNLARACARAGVDSLHCGDDVANQRTLMFRVELWRRFMKPRWAQIWAAARAIKPDIQILYHSDGNVETIINELREIGMTILNPLQPECMDLDRLAGRYRGRLLFDGSIGTQTVFPFGTPDGIRRCVAERMRQFGQDIRLAPTHVLEPEVPMENIFAFFAAVDAMRLRRDWSA